ncbi:uncharacterized protein, partial [Musca autumnalis]|uniref:uncharacterized protein n=1 Tax=Musca autumnalis TaxID=221902 RepID=UPI003CEC2209
MLDAEVANNIGISGQKTELELHWMNSQKSREKTQVVNLKISGNEGSSEIYEMNNVYITKKLNLPKQSLNLQSMMSDRTFLRGIPIEEYKDVKPKMIISLSHAYLTVPLESPKILSPQGPIAIKTRLGWIVYGPAKHSSNQLISCHAFKSETELSSLAEMEELMKGYFGLETFGVRLPTEPLLSNDDRRALDILEKTTRRVGERYESGLLWRGDFSHFPDSFGMAYKRLTTIEKKMSKDPNFGREYRAKINEYVEKGYARKLTPEEADSRSQNTFYLPHFGVVNPNKAKVRLVFDAAAEVENVSLNKALLSGPDMNQPLMKVLLKFRQSQIAVCGDLKEMFHQVIVKKEDQDAQRFLWRDGDTSKPLETYVMQRMTFGATCSPTMAQYVKNKNAMEFGNSHPRAVKAILEKHYVDDYVDSFDSEEEAANVVQAVKEIHYAGGFEMHNIITNSNIVANKLGICNNCDPVNVGKGVERILG